MRHEEAGWNAEVHYRILEAVFRALNSVRSADHEFNFSICTTARLDTVFLPRRASTKMVDFCIFADINIDETWRQAHRELCRRICTRTVNYTDFTPFQLYPIILSIEIKKPGKETDDANL